MKKFLVLCLLMLAMTAASVAYGSGFSCPDHLPSASVTCFHMASDDQKTTYSLSMYLNGKSGGIAQYEVDLKGNWRNRVAYQEMKLGFAGCEGDSVRFNSDTGSSFLIPMALLTSPAGDFHIQMTGGALSSVPAEFTQACWLDLPI